MNEKRPAGQSSKKGTRLLYVVGKVLGFSSLAAFGCGGASQREGEVAGVSSEAEALPELNRSL